jgi:hypothetical protein
MICHWEEPAAALQIRENAISTFSMKGLEPLLEQALKIHVGLPARLSVIPMTSPSGQALTQALADSAASHVNPAPSQSIGDQIAIIGRA